MSGRHSAVKGGRRRTKRVPVRISAAAASAIVTAVALTPRLTTGANEPLPRALTSHAGTDAVEPTSSAASAAAALTNSLTARADVPAPRKASPTKLAHTEPPFRTVPEKGSGRFKVALGRSDVVGSGELVTYSVEVEGGVRIDPATLAAMVDNVLSDRRGWSDVSGRSFQRVATDPDYRIRLATPRTTDTLCAPLDTGGRLSCRNGDDVVLNAWRWDNGATAYRGHLGDYRRYMINHEFGHALGNSHRACPRDGAPAPVMVQQTKGLDGCIANPWPAPTHG